MAPVLYSVDPDETRYYREQASPFSFLYDMARENAYDLWREGRRPILGGLLSKEIGSEGVSTREWEGIGPALVGLLSAIGKPIDLPYSAQQGLIPEADLVPEVMSAAALAMGGGGLSTTPKNSLRSGVSRTQSDLPPASNASEAMARQILELRAASRSNEVTNEMMGAADNQYMFANTPLDMSQAARMARADEMFPREGFHGTNADIDAFQGNVFSTDNPTLASTYRMGSEDAQIYPLRLGSKLGDAVVEGKGKNWNQFDIDELYESNPELADYVKYGFSSFGDGSMSTSTRDIEQAAKSVGLSGVQFKNIYDTGPGFNSTQFKNKGYTKEQERALQKQYMEDLSKPSNVDVRLSPNLVRSRFARFDPEFSNLSNISAANRSKLVGLLALQEMQKRANEKQYTRGLLE